MISLQFSCFLKTTTEAQEEVKYITNDKQEIKTNEIGTDIKSEMENKYEEINIFEFLDENKESSFDEIKEKMQGKNFHSIRNGRLATDSEIYCAQVVSKHEPDKPRQIIGSINLSTIDLTNYYIWFETYVDEADVLICDDVQLLIQKDCYVFRAEIISESPEKEFIWGLYFYDKNTHLKAEVYYTPQYLVVVDKETASFTIQKNEKYKMLSGL